MAFEAFLTQDRTKPRKGRRLTLTLSLIVHGALLVAALVYSFWHVDELSPPVVTVTFLTNTPPPPPPPPPKTKSTTKTRVTPREITQPKRNEMIQPKQKEDEPEPDDGVEGGVEGGVLEGVVDQAPPPAAAPPPKPVDAPPKFVPPKVASQQLLTDPRSSPAHRVTIPGALANMRLWAMVKVCVSKTGSVSDARIIKGMDPAVDPQLVAKIRSWRYKPMTLEGTPISFCYNLRYEHAPR